MSAVAQRRAPVRGYNRVARPAPTARPKLRVVKAPTPPRHRVPFALTCIAMLAGSLLAALVFNVQAASLAFERYELTNEIGRLNQDRMDLVAELDARSAPERLAQDAHALGMVESNGTGWLRLSDGAVLGDPQPATG